MKNKAAQSLGRLGGSKTSPAKADAARANGAKGGRPPFGGAADRATAAAADPAHKDSVSAYHATGETGNFAAWNNAFNKARGNAPIAKSNYERRMGANT